MPDVIVLAIDKLKRGQREELFLKLLTYAGPPPRGGGYTDWCKVVECGTRHMFPAWGVVDILDATVQFRHWCTKRGIKQQRVERINNLVNVIQSKVRRMF